VNRDRDLELAFAYDPVPPPPPQRYHPPVQRKPDFEWPLVGAFLKRYKWTVVAVFLATVVSGYATLSMFTEQYDVEAEILVKLGRENLDPPATSRNTPLATGLRREDLMSEVQILRSPVLIRRLVDDIGPEAFQPRITRPAGFVQTVKYHAKTTARWAKRQWKDFLIALDLQKRLPERDAAVQDLIERLTVEPRKESDVLALRLRIPDPALGTQILDRLLNLYMSFLTGQSEESSTVATSGCVHSFFVRHWCMQEGEGQSPARNLAVRPAAGLHASRDSLYRIASDR